MRCLPLPLQKKDLSWSRVSEKETWLRSHSQPWFLFTFHKIRKGAGELKCLYVHVGVAREVLKKKGITKMDISSVNSACNLNFSSLI